MPHAATPSRAFTLIEMIAVLVIVAIMASMVMPRLGGNDKRQFKLTVDEVGDLLTMFAQRHNLGQKIVGIRHNTRRNWLELLVLDTDGSVESHVATWHLDAYVQPVKFPAFMYDTDVSISINGDVIDASDQPVSCEIGQERPWIEISLRGAGEQATLALPPYGVAPTLTSSYQTSGVARESYDLDRTGRSREDW